jgi:hypothetical protein
VVVFFSKMPKINVQWFNQANKDIFAFDNNQSDKVFCRACSKTILCTKKSHLVQHEKTSLHQERLKSKSRQMLISEPRNTAEKNTFALDLCSALVAANIPWAKLDCPQFKVFLEKYCDS